METNKEKGDKYEIQIRNHIINVDKKRAYLWHHTPETLLIQNGIIGSHNDHRITRQRNKLNSLQDTGIDIIIDNNENDIENDNENDIENDIENDNDRKHCSIVQCKNGYKNGILMEDLAGFMCWFGSLPKLNGYVYYTSKLSKNIKELPENDRMKYIKIAYSEKNNHSLSKEIQKVKIIKPYNYQKEAASKFINFHRGILTLPCGTGKTLTSYLISKKYKQIIIISPLKQFAKQNLDRFIEYGFKKEILLIDSDGERDIETIIQFIQKNHSFLLSCTFKSIDVICKIIKYLNKKEVIFIIDEFHNLSLNNIADEENDFYQLLYSDQRILFMSATPRIYDLEDKHIDFCDDSVFGDILYKMSFNEAIEKKYITDYRIWLPSISETNSKLLDELSIYHIDNVIKSKCIFFISCLSKNGSRKCIIYCIDNNEIDLMIKAMHQLNDYYCFDYEMNKINANCNAKSRDLILNDFQYKNDKIQLLFSIRILDECIDVASCDSIFITYPSQSKIRTIQRLCRCIRIDTKNPYKMGNIYIWCNQYDEILNTLSGLKEYDSMFRNKIKMSENNFYGRREKNDLLINDIKSIKNYLIGVKEFKDISWKEKLDILVEFFKVNKKRPLHSSNDGKERSLAIWLYSQIQNSRNCSANMTNEKIRLLWDEFKQSHKKYFLTNEEIWYKKLEEATLFLEKNKKRPLAKSEDEDEKILGSWISHQITNHERRLLSMKDEKIYLAWDDFKQKHLKILFK